MQAPLKISWHGIYWRIPYRMEGSPGSRLNRQKFTEGPLRIVVLPL